MSDHDVSMKPLLGKLIEEAVTLALIDSCWPPGRDESWTPEERAALRDDIHAMPSAALAGMDPLALAQNVGVRLLGSGGWLVGGQYAGNATARDLFDASFSRPDRSHVSEVAFDVLRAMEDATALRRVDDDCDGEDR